MGLSKLLEIVLTREDANSESAFLAEWLVEDRARVRKGEEICVVETSKASVEIGAGGEGLLVQLVPAGVELELGTCIALVVQEAAELAEAEARQTGPAPVAPQPVLRTVTRRAAELAAQHGVDLEQIDKTGFVTAADVEALIRGEDREPEESDLVLAGLSVENVTLPQVFRLDGDEGTLDPDFLASLRADPAGFGGLSSDEKCEAYRRHGARIGEGVTLARGAVVVAPRVVLEDGVTIDEGGSIVCEEVFAAGELALFGPSFRLNCRRAFVGAGTWSGHRVQIGGGGSRDPWATFVLGELGFIGDEVFVNVCRPVVIGREVFLTMRSILLTHNIGHSVFEGFENRFAGVVVEDRAQIGVGAVVYAGCRVGGEAIVASNSYVVSDVPAGALAIGVPARASGHASRAPARSRQVALARQMIDDFGELLSLRGVPVESLDSADIYGFELTGSGGPGRVLFAEKLVAGTVVPGDGETVVLTLELSGPPPDGCAVLDLLARRVHGAGNVLLDSTREFCRKRGIRFEPGPWRYGDGLL